MPSPFPGMDPYIERGAIWPDFHDSLISAVKAALQPVLRPRYVALGKDRLYVVESERPIYPDLAILRTKAPRPATGSAAVLATTDQPAVFELWREEIRQPLLEIIETAANNRVVTAIEVLSPDNKRNGPGRDSYLNKREEYWAAGTNLVEIDLLREGETTVRLSKDKLDQLRPWHYLVAINRRWPSRQEIHAIPLQRRLPRVAIPVGSDDSDVPLDLQAALARCWDEGPYPELLQYDGSPPGNLTSEELDWCDITLRTAGYKAPPPGNVTST